MFYSVPQAAEALHVHPNTIYNFIKRGRIVAFKGPYGWEVLRSSVELLENDQYKYTSQIEQVVQVLQASKLLLNEFQDPMLINLTGVVRGHWCPSARNLLRNEAYMELLGWPEHKLGDLSCSDLIHADDLETVHDIAGVIRRQPYRKEYTEVRILRSDRGIIWVRGSGMIAPFGPGVNLVISKLKRI